MVEIKVAKMVGNTISAGEVAPSEVLSAITEEGIICILVAFITKNIVIAYSVFGYFSSSLIDLIPIGVVAPLIPSILAEMFIDIKSFAFSGRLPNKNLFIGLSNFANLYLLLLFELVLLCLSYRVLLQKSLCCFRHRHPLPKERIRMFHFLDL